MQTRCAALLASVLAFSGAKPARNLLAFLGCILLCSPAVAHHANTTLFDDAAPLRLDGTVREFVWQNPHARIQLLVTDAEGDTKEWSVEMAPPASLYRLGWRQDTVKAGDKLSVTVWPLRNGAAGGQARDVVIHVPADDDRAGLGEDALTMAEPAE